MLELPLIERSQKVVTEREIKILAPMKHNYIIIKGSMSYPASGP
jgi:hypothetical protein